MFFIFSTPEKNPKRLKRTKTNKIQRDLENNKKDLEKINDEKEDLKNLKRKVEFKKDSQPIIK